MAQLTVYLDDDTLKKIEAAAKREHKSISQWVKNRLVGAFKNTWPKDYFKLFGSLSENDISRPQQPPLKDDIKRQSL